MHFQEFEDKQKQLHDCDLGFVTKRFAEEQQLSPEIAAQYEKEFKKFILLKFAQKRRYGMNGKVDDYWHTFIVHTEEYQEFCDKLFGRFLHHRPASDSQAKNSMEGLSYFRMLVDYFRFFKEPPPKDIWPYSYELFGDATDWELQGGICIAPCWTNCEA